MTDIYRMAGVRALNAVVCRIQKPLIDNGAIQISDQMAYRCFAGVPSPRSAITHAHTQIKNTKLAVSIIQ